MSTRLYLSMREAAPVAPAFGQSCAAAWSSIAGAARHKLVGAKDPLDAITNGPTININVADHIPSGYACGQWISAPMHAFTFTIATQTVKGWTAGTFHGASHGSPQLFLTLKVYVVSGDGTITRGTLIDPAGYFGGVADTPAAGGGNDFDGPDIAEAVGYGQSAPIPIYHTVNVQEGDRIVVEQGFANAFGIGSYTAHMVFGAPSSVADAAANTEIGTVPWIEFSNNIPFVLPPAPDEPTLQTGPFGIELLDPRRRQSGWGVDGFCAFGASDDAPKAARLVDHTITGANRLIAQYHDRPNMSALVRVLCGSFQPLEDAQDFELQKSGLEGALANLDGTGSLFQVVRDGLSDNAYRIRLAGNAQAFGAPNTPESVRNVLQELMQGANAVRLREDFPGSTVLLVYELTADEGAAFARILASSPPAGTRVILEFEVPLWQGLSVGWVDDNSGADWAEWGTDPTSAGFWGEAADGRS